MAKVEIVEDLKNEVFRKFKGESLIVFKFMRSLGENPRKGKFLGRVGGLAIKEMKYKNFRFYFIVDENKLKIFSQTELKDLLIKFVRMSNKKDQQETINEIKKILLIIGADGFK